MPVRWKKKQFDLYLVGDLAIAFAFLLSDFRPRPHSRLQDK